MNSRTKKIVYLGLLLGIEAVFCFTPLGSLPAFGPIVMTLAMIPVIITGQLLGKNYGALMGLAAGTFSLIVWTFFPSNPLLAFLFSPFYTLGKYQGNFGSLLICFLPRILTGYFAGLFSEIFNHKRPNKTFANNMWAAIIGSLTNTFGVLGLAGVFFSAQYSDIASGTFFILALGTILTNGVPEAILAGVLCPNIVKALKKTIK